MTDLFSRAARSLSAKGARVRGILGVPLLMVGAHSAPAFAQAVPNQPAPGALPTREELDPALPPAPAQPQVNVDSRGALERPNCPFEGSTLTVDISRVSFSRPDGSPIPPEIALTLNGIAAPGGTTSLVAVCDIRDAANAALRRDGWIASVQVPPQEITTGELKLNVITARIVEVRVRGNPGPYEGLLRERVEQLKKLDPLNEKDAERLLLLAGDIPGIDVQLSLRPAGTEPGAVVGDLGITYRPFAILGNAQNYNSRLLGRETGYLRGEYYGLTGMGDVTYLGASSTVDFREQIIVQAGHVMTLNSAGTTAGVRGTFAWSRPDVGALDLKTETLVAGFDIRHPLIRSVTKQLAASVGFDYVDQDTKAGTAPLNRDRLRVAYAALDGEARGVKADGTPIWFIRGGLSLRKGLGIFDATPIGGVVVNGALPSRFDGNSRAWVIRGDLDTELKLPSIFTVAARAQGQWADKALLNYEEFSLGNLTIGRGYDPGSNSGDRAVGVRSELRAEVVNSPKLRLEAFGFGDVVWLTNLDRGSTEVDRTLRSVGGGVRAVITNTALVEVTYAKPLDRVLRIDRDKPPARLLMSLTFQFRPRAR